MAQTGYRISRRQLLKLALAGAVGMGLPVGAFSLAGAQSEPRTGGSVSRTTGASRSALPTICHGCSARCGLLGFAEDGILVKLAGNPADPNSRGALCARGQAGTNYVYSPERLTQPLRREGARRGGKLVPVSWDEALGELAERVRRLSPPEGLVILSGTLLQRGLLARFAAACGTPNLQFDELLYRGNLLAAGLLTHGSALVEADVANSKYILNFGANPYESHPAFVPFVRRLVDARLNGARLITLDPRLSNTAGRSDRWLPLRPGTDAMVALAMARVIVDRGLHDQAFLRDWTDLTPALLTEMLAGQDPAAAAKAAGLDSADLEQVAVEFARTKPTCAIAGGGVGKHANGVAAQRAVLLLNALMGNLGVRGGLYRPPVYALKDLAPAPTGAANSVWPVLAPSLPAQADVLSEIAAGRVKADVLLLHKANPAFARSGSAGQGELLADRDRLPFTVAYDSFLTESAELADLVLPAATYLEAWDLDSVPALDRVPYVLLAQPASRPPSGVVDAPELYSELARRIDKQVAGFFPFSSGEDWATRLAGQLPGLAGAEGMRQLRTSGLWQDPAGEVPYGSALAGGLATPSGKMEFSPGSLARRGLALPQAKPPAALADGEFHLIVYQVNVHHGGESAASKWLSEIAHDSPLWLNAAVAGQRGLRDGDRVRLASATGEVQTTVRLGNGIRPDVVAMADGAGHWALSRVARAVPFASDDPDTALLWWGKQGNGAAAGKVLQGGFDPVGGGIAWHDTRVRLELVERGGA